MTDWKNWEEPDTPDTFTDLRREWQPEKAHLIVLGNEKGGSGKSTAAMHIAVGLLRMGYRVGTLDLDARQGTITRYMSNRFDFVKRTGRALPMSAHLAIMRSKAESVAEQQAEERDFWGMALEELSPSCDFIIADTPGTDSYLSRLAHSHADTLVTPMNDSFVDLDLIADIDPDTMEVRGPSVYAQMIHDQRIGKALRGSGTIDWLVMRTRLSHIAAKNKRDIGTLLENLAERFDFRIAPGFGERVVFREMFLKGLTLLDAQDDIESAGGLTLSQVAARQEVRALLAALRPRTLKHAPDNKIHTETAQEVA